MITILILVLLMLILGGLLGVLMARDPGYVLIAYDGLTVETSLWVGLVIGVVIWVSATFGWTLLKRLMKSRGAWFRWRREGRRAASQKRTEEALLLRAEGRWNDALAAYASAADNAELPLANWIHAAEAAHRSGDDAARDDFFAKAEHDKPHAALALALIKAELQQESGQWAESEATLGAWVERAPRHPRLNAMRLRAAAALGDWNTAHALLPVVTGTIHVSKDEARQYAIGAWCARLDEVAKSDIAAQHAQSLWKSIPKDLRVAPAVVERFIEIIGRDAAHDGLVETSLREALDVELSAALIERYGTTIVDAKKQAEAVARWLERARQQDAEPALQAMLLYADACLADARGEADIEQRLRSCVEMFPLGVAKAALGRHLLTIGDAPAAREALTSS